MSHHNFRWQGTLSAHEPTLLPVFIKPNSTVAVVTEIINKDIQQVTDTHPHADTDQADTQYHTSHAHNHSSTTDQYDNMTHFPFSGVHNINTELDAKSLSDEQYIAISKEIGINLDESDLTDEQKHELYIFLGQNRKVLQRTFLN